MLIRCLPDLNLRYRHLDGGLVFFEELSGSTHIMDGFSGGLLLSLYTSPIDSSELKKAIANQLKLESGEDVDAYYDSLIASFTKLEFIR